MLAYDRLIPASRLKSVGEIAVMSVMSHIVTDIATQKCHKLCDDSNSASWQIVTMESQDKNGGPNYLQAWRDYRGLSQAQLAEKVGTNHNMIGYLESGERGLSAKWLRKLADALETTPGMILDHDPNDLDNDIIDIWAHADKRGQKLMADIAASIVKTGTND